MDPFGNFEDQPWLLIISEGERAKEVRIEGHFVMSTSGIPVWFQGTNGSLYFIRHIISAEKQSQPRILPDE